MYRPYQDHLIRLTATVKEALAQLNRLASDAILFVVDEEQKLLGALTDGDLRRGFLKDLTFDAPLQAFLQPHPKFVRKGGDSIEKIIAYRSGNFKIIPVLDEQDRVVNVINFRFFKSYLPLDAVIMAGGRGERLRPLTDSTPKPLLKVGQKPIIEHNIDRLCAYGVDDMWLSVRYLGEQLQDYFGDGAQKSIRIQYIWENNPLGTIGALRSITDFSHEHVLVMNSDLLTNIDFEDFYLFFLEQKADFAVACIPYQVNVPYAVMETQGHLVTGFKEKPSYTYYSNAGIYLMKRSVIANIPEGAFFNTTDLMQKLIKEGGKVASYPLTGYWLDIGKPEDYQKAQEDIKHLSL